MDRLKEGIAVVHQDNRKAVVEDIQDLQQHNLRVDLEKPLVPSRMATLLLEDMVLDHYYLAAFQALDEGDILIVD